MLEIYYVAIQKWIQTTVNGRALGEKFMEGFLIEADNI